MKSGLKPGVTLAEYAPRICATGSQRSWTPRMRMIDSAMRKSGTESTNEPTDDTRWSKIELRQYAARSPSAVPMENESSRPPPTMKSVHGSTERMIDITVVPEDRNEFPRSPRMTFAMNEMYCSWKGASRSIEKRFEATARALS